MQKKKTQPARFSPYGWAAFLIPVVIMIICYANQNIYPGSERTVLASDAFSQFSNFHASFNNMLRGKQSIFYTWNSGLGLNYWALISYYLGGLFTPLVFFFKNSAIADTLYWLTLLKIGLAGLAFWYYSHHTFKLSPWNHVSLSVCYSLMSFITSHSELIMWLDTFIWLPLIILGINRLMDQAKLGLLFVSYLALFISNYYFGFMVGVFSFLYFWARAFSQWARYKKRIAPYLITSLLAGFASMIMILPTLIDLRTHGEELTEITKLKTAASGFWDIVIKNMVGVFDTTKYEATAFIYCGLIPIIFAIFYFLTPKISRKRKGLAATLLLLLAASFYLEPLNLFWQGMHAPNMFLYRFSFLFSFLVLMLAGYGLEVFWKTPSLYFVGSVIALMALYIVAYFVHPKESYSYINEQTLFTTLLFLLLYLLGIMFYQLYNQQQPFSKKQLGRLAILLLVVVALEASLNTHKMLTGISQEWNYPSRSLFEKPFNSYQASVELARKKEGTTHFRLETLDPVSANDSLTYNYNGISQFSSIRNRNSATLLNQLGYRSRGSNLNIRYQNNTLLMDSLFGIKYNLDSHPSLKYGFTPVTKKGDYYLASNQLAAPLGIKTTKDIYQTKFPKLDNLGAQTNLFNQLSGQKSHYFTYRTPEIVSSTNSFITETKQKFSVTEEKANLGKTIFWKVQVPAGKQAYLSLYPKDFGALKSSTVTVNVQQQQHKSQIDITGQYYDLGYSAAEQTIYFSTEFYGTATIDLLPPIVIFLDIPAFQKGAEKLQNAGVQFNIKGRRATAYTTVNQADQVLFTTLPFDEGWHAYVDGKPVPIKAFKNGFLTIPLSKGSHKIELRFLPKGFVAGLLAFGLSIVAFLGYQAFLSKQRQTTLTKPPTKSTSK